MRRNEFESRYNNWEGRQLVAVITPSSYGRTALRVQWAGLEEVREAAAVSTNWSGWPADGSEGFDTFDAAESYGAADTDSSNNLEPNEKAPTSSTFDEIEVFIEEVVLLLNASNGVTSFGLPNGDFMVTSEKADASTHTLIAKTIEAINKAWKSKVSVGGGWEMPSIYVDYSGKP